MDSIAEILLKKEAVTLNIKSPYTYSSGIRSPIYCDNRSLAGFVEERKEVVKAYAEKLENIEYDVIAGTSTAGIQWAAWIAWEIDKPMAYVRGKAKKHGKGNQIEGAPVSGKNVVVIEDLISTGGSSIDAVDAVRENGGKVNFVVSIFTYELEKASNLFKQKDCNIVSLTSFSKLVDVAGQLDYLAPEDIKIASEWNKDPVNWGPRNGFENAK